MNFTGAVDSGSAMDARPKILIAFSLILACVTTPITSPAAFVVYLAFALLWGAFSGASAVRILFSAAAVIPFTLAAALFVPFMNTGAAGGYYVLAGVSLSKSGLLILAGASVKAYVCAACLFTLSAITPFPKLMEGLERLRVPAGFVNIIGFTHRQIFSLAGEARRMKLARDLRLYGGKWIWNAGVAGGMIGTLYVRGYERGERIYNAMLSRGHSGSFITGPARAMTMKDMASVAASALFLLAVRIAS